MFCIFRVFYRWSRLPACWVMRWCHREPRHQDQTPVGPVGKRQNVCEVSLPSCFIWCHTHQKWPLVLQKPLPVFNTQLNAPWLYPFSFPLIFLQTEFLSQVAEELTRVVWYSTYCISSHVCKGEFKKMSSSGRDPYLTWRDAQWLADWYFFDNQGSDVVFVSFFFGFFVFRRIFIYKSNHSVNYAYQFFPQPIIFKYLTGIQKKLFFWYWRTKRRLRRYIKSWIFKGSLLLIGHLAEMSLQLPAWH